MKERDLDTLIVSRDAQYLAETEYVERMILTEDKSISLCHRLNGDKAKQEANTDEVVVFSEKEVPLRETEEVFFGEFHEIAGNVLEDFGSEKIGYDKLSDEVQKKIEETYPAEYQEESNIIKDLRKTKTEEEIRRMRRAGKIAAEGMKKAREMAEPGNTEIEIAAEIEYEMKKRGSEDTAFTTIVAAGHNSKYPHVKASDKKLEKGELLVVDLGAQWKDYNSDMTRTFAISPSKKQKELMEITKKAQKNALEKLKSGKKASEIDKAARKVFNKEGYEKNYLHTTGHGVGRNIHEPPRLSISSEVELKKNMVVTVEPGLYTDKLGGCRFEDMVLVQEDGYQKLTSR